MTKRIFAAALLACGIGGIVAAWAADLSERKGKTAAELSDARLALAKQGFDLSLEAYLSSHGQLNAHDVARWSKRAVDVARLGNDKVRLTTVLEEHRDRMRRLLEIVIDEQKNGLRAEIDKIEPEYLLLEAESWVQEAKAAN